MIKYVIRPSKRQELLDIINEKYVGDKKSRGRGLVIYNKPMSYTRWANWFDLETLDKALMQEGYEELEVSTEKVSTEDVNFNDLGI